MDRIRDRNFIISVIPTSCIFYTVSWHNALFCDSRETPDNDQLNFDVRSKRKLQRLFQC